MSTTVKVLNAKAVVETHKVQPGDVVRITAQENVNYQLINDQTGFGPENIITKRDGSDLKIFLEDGDMKEDIIIENYYAEAGEKSSNLVIGQHENGGLYPYIPESGLESNAVSLLADQGAAAQALGGQELSVAFWAFNPWWLLALAPIAGVAAVAASRGGSKGSSAAAAESTDLLADAKSAVDAAKKAEAELKAAVEAAEKNGLTVDQIPALTEQAKKAEELKAKASELVAKLADSTAEKATLAASVAGIDNTKAAVEAAKAAEKVLDDAIANAQEHGISSKEKSALDEQAKAAEALKSLASNLVNTLPEGDAKAGLTQEVNKIDNSVPNADASAEAQEAVAAAQKAEADLKKAIEDAQKDGITPEEKAALETQATEAEKLKAIAAQEVGKLLADNDDKSGLQELVNQINNAVPPTSARAGLATIGALIKAAKDAENELDLAIEKAKEGGLTAEKKAALDQQAEAAEALKAAAQQAVDNLANDAQTDAGLSKTALDTLVKEIDNSVPVFVDNTAAKAADEEAVSLLLDKAIEAEKALDKAIEKKMEERGVSQYSDLPAADKEAFENQAREADVLKAAAQEAVNSLPDSTVKEGLNTQVKAIDNGLPVEASNPQAAEEKANLDAVKALVEAAKAAEAALDKKIDELKADGVITPEESVLLNNQGVAADALKAKAKAAVDSLPASVADEKAKLETTVNGIDNGVPAANTEEANNFGTLAAAQALVAAAQEANNFLQEKINAGVNAGNKDALEQQAAVAEHLKALADKAVSALPETVAEKAGLDNTVKGLNNTVPSVETDDGKLKAAQELVAAAKAAETALDDRIASEGITPANEDALRADAIKADALKEAAREAVEALPPSVAAEKGDLENTVRGIDNSVGGANVPATDPALDAAKALLDAAKKAEAALDADITTAETDGISPAEKADLDAKAAAAETLKALAQQAVDNLPASADKDSLNTEVGNIDNSVPPAKIDDVAGKGALDAVETLVFIAEEAARQLDDAIAAKANDVDGITAAEKAELDVQAAAADALKAKAQEAVNQLPDTLAAKEGFNDRLDAIDNGVPPVTQAVQNAGDQATIDAAKALVEAAKAAEKALDDKIAELGVDGITPAEKAELDAQAVAANGLKAKAQEAVNNLPATVTDKAALDGIVKTIDNSVPVASAPNAMDKAAAFAVNALVEAAKAAEKALDDKIAELSTDGISADERAALEQQAVAADALKAKAKEALDNLPDDVATRAGVDKAALNNTVQGIDNSVPAPGAGQERSANSNATALVAAAKQAEEDLDNAIEAAQVGGITAEEKAALEKQAADAEALKALAQEAVNALPKEDPYKAVLDSTVKGIDNSVPPAMDPVAEAKAAIDAAKKAEAALDAKIAELQADGITTDEKTDLELQAVEANKLKEIAQQAVNKLPANHAEKAGLDATVKGIDNTVPPVSDFLSAAKDLIAAAKAAEAALDAKIALAQADGITPAEKAALDADAVKADALKAAAKEAVSKLADSEPEKATLGNTVEAIDNTVPAATDFLAAANDALKAAQAAEAALDAEIARVGANGITEDEKKALDKQAEAADALKQAAQEAVNRIPADKVTEKAGLDAQVKAIDNTVPEVTNLLKAAEDALAAAKAAETALDAAILDKAKDGISQDDLNELAKQAKAADALKQAAVDAIAALPTTEPTKDTLADQAKAIDNELPPVTNLLKAAEDALAAAKAAETALDAAILDKAKDGISQDDLNELAKQAKAADALKQAAVDAIAALPTTEPTKDTLANQAKAIDNELPPVTDLLKLAEDAVKAAKAAETILDGKVAAAEDDQSVSQDEYNGLKDYKDNTADKLKNIAEKAVDALLPNDYPNQADKDKIAELQALVRGINNDIPTPTGDPSVAINNARDLLNDAIEKQQAAEAALATANEATTSPVAAADVINPAEKAAVEAAVEAAREAKQKAADAINGLPASQEKTQLETDLRDMNSPVTTPDVNDANSNGIKDADDLADATAKVAAAEAKLTEAQAKLRDAETAPKVTENLQNQVKAANDALKAAKTAANEALKQVPTSVYETEKDALYDRLAKLDPVAVPSVTPEATTTQPAQPTKPTVNEVKALVKEAEDKQKAAHDKLAELNADKNIDPTEKQLLEALQREATAARKKAEDAVAQLDEADKGSTLPPNADNTPNEGNLPGRLDALKDIVIPDNISNNNPTDPLAEARQAVEKAKELATAAQKAATDAKGQDDVVNPKEAAKVELANDALADAIAKAQTALNNVTDQDVATDKAALQTTLNGLRPADVPAVNDNNSNNVKDEYEAAMAKVAEAEKASTDLKAEIAKLSGDAEGLTPAEAMKLNEMADAANALKLEAQTAVDGLKAGDATKTDLQAKLDAIDNTVPEVEENIPDNTLDDVEKLVVAAEEKFADAENVLDEGLSDDGKLTRTERTDVEKAVAATLDPISKAQAKVDALPDGPTKAGYQKRLDDLKLTIPTDKELEAQSKEEDDPHQWGAHTVVTGRYFNKAITDPALNKLIAKNPELTAPDSITKGAITMNDAGADHTVVVGRNNDYTIAHDATLVQRLPVRYGIHDAKIDTSAGNGNDKILITGSVNSTGISKASQATDSHGARILTGAGDDVVKIAGNVQNGSRIDLGSGDDKLFIQAHVRGWSHLTLGEGNNEHVVNGQYRFGIKTTAGAGDDKVTIGWGIDVTNHLIEDRVTIDLGEGNNTLSIGKRAKRLVGNADIITGSGNDDIYIRSSKLHNVKITSGAGNDIIDLKDAVFFGLSGVNNKDNKTGSIVEAGAGADTIKLGNLSYANLAARIVKIDAGEGNDTVEMHYSFDATKTNHQGFITGGSGTDTLALKGKTVVNLKVQPLYGNEGIKDFELIDMTDTGAQTIKLTKEDVLNNHEVINGVKTLYISGGAEDTVDLGANGAPVRNNVPTADALGQFTKVDSDKDTKEVNGETRSYTAYTNGTDVKVYIDDQITQII